MIKAELSDAIMELNPEERLDLARRLIESVVQPEHLSDAIERGISRIEDVAAGRVAALSEEQYRAAIG